MERIERLVGMYDADGTVLGELAYVVSHALGRRSCSLCGITHGTLRRKPGFDAVAATLPVPLELLHRDEQSAGGELTVLVAADTLAACAGEPDALIEAIRRAAADRGFALDAA